MKRSTVIRALAMVIGIAFVALFPSPDSHAQTVSRSITISPTTAQYSIDAGSTASGKVDVINGGSDSYNVNLTVNPYRVTNELYDPNFTQLPGTVDASGWVTLDTATAHLEGAKLITVGYTVAVPQNTAPGGYYAIIFASTAPDNDDTQGIVPSNRVGTILYITVNGDIKTSGSVTATDVPKFTFSPVIPFGVKVANDGGVHFTTTAKFRITDLFGNEVYSNTQEKIVLPSTVRDISTSWTSALPIGIYNIQREATAAGKTYILDEQRMMYISPWFLTCVVIFLASVISLLVVRIRQRKAEK